MSLLETLQWNDSMWYPHGNIRKFGTYVHIAGIQCTIQLNKWRSA